MVERIGAAVLGVIVAVLSGCSAQHTVTYQNPLPTMQWINEKIVSRPLDDVWDAAIPALGKSFFTINNMEKSSGFISVTHTGADPTRYVDCGKTQITGKDGATQSVARAQTFAEYNLVGEGGNSYKVTQSMQLDSAINIIFEAVEEDSRPKIVQLEEDQPQDDAAEQDEDDIGLRLKHLQVPFHGAEAALILGGRVGGVVLRDAGLFECVVELHQCKCHGSVIADVRQAGHVRSHAANFAKSYVSVFSVSRNLAILASRIVTICAFADELSADHPRGQSAKGG